MDPSLVGHLERAFELALFMHRDKALALQITLDAMTRVEVLAAAQDRRRGYRPAGRSRVFMTRAQLLQRLVYISSEPHERRQEDLGGDLDEDTMTIRYMACLARICLRRNAFHVAVGFGRLLYAYPTGDVLALYDLVTQDPERLRDPDYVRARKKRLVDELRRRFGAALKLRRAQRGEWRFEARETGAELLRLVGRCLELMTPWDTSCTVPEVFRPTTQKLEALRFNGGHPDEEHPIEMNRIHALLHPGCLSRLTRALGLTPPTECLEVPLLSRAEGYEGGDGEDRGERRAKLGDDDRRAVLNELGRRGDLRRRVEGGVFRVLLDGVETALWDTERSRGLRLTVDERAELVEVVAREQGEDVVLAAHLLPDLGDATLSPPPPASVRLPGGQRFDFVVSRSPGEPSGARVEIAFSESLLKRLVGALGISKPRKVWQPAGALVLAFLAALGTGLFLGDPDAPSGPPRTRGPSPAAAALAEVHRVFVDPLGTDLFAEELRASLSVHLAVEGGPTVVSQRSDADAVLMLDPGSTSGEAAPRIALRLVNARGEELWRGESHVDRDAVEEVAARIAAELVAELSAGTF